MRLPLSIWLAVISVAAVAPSTALAQWTLSGTPVCTATGVQADPVTVADGSGGCFIAWDDTRSGSPQIWAQHLSATGAATWAANGINVCNQAGSETLPQIVSDGSGGCIIVWQDTRSGTAIIYGQRLNGSGALQWTSAGVALTNSTASQTMVVSVADGAGGVIAAWLDTRTSFEIYCQRLSGNGGAQWTAAGVRATPASSPGSGFTGPRVDADGSGGALITGAVASTSVANGQRISGAGAPLWGTDGIPVQSLGVGTLVPVGADVLGDGSGGAYLASITAGAAGSPTVESARHVDGASANVVGWLQPGGGARAGREIALAPKGGTSTSARIVPGGAGGAIFLACYTDRWNIVQLPSGDQVGAISAHGFSPAGPPHWEQTIEGLSWNDNTSPVRWRGIADGSGGAIVAWTGNGDGLYAIRLGHAGVNAGWPATGTHVVDGTGVPVLSSLCGDNAGGAILVYARGGDIYAANVTGAGAVTSVGPWSTSAPAGPSVRSVKPNPTWSAVRVAFTMPTAGAVRLEVFDVQGRLLLERDGGQLAAGSHEYDLAPLDPLPTGVYDMRLTVGGVSSSARFVVRR